MSTTDNHQIVLTKSLTVPLLSYVSSCTKLTTETHRLKNRSKIYAEYGIPAHETILVYCRSGIPFVAMALTSVLFTDQAFYCQAYNEDSKNYTSYRISYQDFGKYLFCQYDKKGAMYVASVSGELEILRGTLLLKNTAAIETCNALCAIQNTLFSLSTESCKHFFSLVQWTKDYSRNSMKIGMLPDQANHMLYALTKLPTYCSDAWILLAENLFRQCDLENYKQFLSDNSTVIPPATLAEIENSVQQFSHNLLQDLSNLQTDFQPMYLNKVLKSESTLLAHRCAVSYARIRYGECDKAFGGVHGLRSPDSTPEFTTLSEFLCLYGHRKMSMIHSNLMENTAPEKNDFHLTDGLGLTPLHYAVIVGCDDIALSLMVKRHWTTSTNMWIKDPIASLLSYPVLAEISQTPIRNQVFIFTHPDVYPLSDKYFSLKSERDHLPEKIERAQTAIQTATRTISKMRSANRPPDQIVEKEEQLRSHQERLHDLLHRQEELEWEIADALKIADAALQKALKETENTVTDLRRSKDPVVQFFWDLYTGVIPLQSLHSLNYSDETVHFYVHSNYFFMLPESIPLKCEHRKVYISSDGCIQDPTITKNPDVSTTKKHLDSWFSPKAKSDIQILKEEFRELAKLYHPDINPKPDATETFQEILNEYHTIEEILNT